MYIFIKKLLLPEIASNVWIGANDRKTEKFFTWVGTNKALQSTYRNWKLGEPNNSGGGEDCGLFLTDAQWNDASCGRTFPYICEMGLCGDNATYRDVAGGFRCECDSGFTGDGYTCTCKYIHTS